MRWSKIFFFLSLICCTFNSVGVYSCYEAGQPNTISVYDSLKWADYYYNIQRYNKAIPIYEKNLVNPDAEKTHILKRLALSEAALNHVDRSTTNLTKYLQLEFKPNFLLNEGFDPIRKEQGFKKISDKMIPKVTTWSLFYLFVAIVGFYVVLILCLNKQIYRTSRFLIASFIFIHSLFILHLSINSANYFFQYTHTYLMSTWAIFLYGPLLYFYFKKTTTGYTFRPIDILHLLPSLVLLTYLVLNVYTMTEESKITLMLSRMQNGLGPQDSNRLVILVIFKIISLSVYGYFIGKVYNKGKNNKLLDLKSLTWQKNVYHIHILYVFTNTAYGIVIIKISQNDLFLFYSENRFVIVVLYSRSTEP